MKRRGRVLLNLILKYLEIKQPDKNYVLYQTNAKRHFGKWGNVYIDWVS